MPHLCHLLYSLLEQVLLCAFDHIYTGLLVRQFAQCMCVCLQVLLRWLYQPTGCKTQQLTNLHISILTCCISKYKGIPLRAVIRMCFAEVLFTLHGRDGFYKCMNFVVLWLPGFCWWMHTIIVVLKSADCFVTAFQQVSMCFTRACKQMLTVRLLFEHFGGEYNLLSYVCCLFCLQRLICPHQCQASQRNISQFPVVGRWAQHSVQPCSQSVLLPLQVCVPYHCTAFSFASSLTPSWGRPPAHSTLQKSRKIS